VHEGTIQDHDYGAARVHEWTTNASTLPSYYEVVWIMKTKATAAGSCVGDLDGDGEVGILDFLKLLGAWGPCP
jgi:hypothetical protein